MMYLGSGRVCKMTNDNDFLTRIKAKPEAQRTWRMKQMVLCQQHCSDALDKCAKQDFKTKLAGLAHALLCGFHGVGYQVYDPKLPSSVIEVVTQIRFDPAYFTRIPKGNGREVVVSNMQPGDNVLMLAAEAYVLWLNYKTLQVHGSGGAAEMQEAERLLDERLHNTLAKLSGNLASTVRDAQGNMSQAAANAGVSMIPLGDGLSAPADVVVAMQLEQYGLHPKQLAWVMNELKYDAAKGRALRERHRPSIEAMQQAANAMVLLACDPEAQTQHPSTDLSAAAAAAVRMAVGSSANGSAGGGSSGSSSGSSRTMMSGSDHFLPQLGSVPDDMVLQMIRGTPVSALKCWLEAQNVSTRACFEKEDLVQLTLKTYKSGASTTTPQPTQQQGSGPLDLDRVAPYDMTRWRHMALFYKAEAGEAGEGRPPHVVSAHKAAAEIAIQNDDEVWGCLAAWNAARAVKCGGKPYLIGEVLTWLDHAYDCKHKMATWHGYLLISGRIDVLKDMKADIKKHAAFYRRDGPGPGSERYSYDSIRNKEVQVLVKACDEKLMVHPHPDMATDFQPAVVGKEPEGKPCANCQHLFVARLVCSGCRSVWYCGKECQTKHWKQHKADCAKLKADREATKSPKK